MATNLHHCSSRRPAIAMTPLHYLVRLPEVLGYRKATKQQWTGNQQSSVDGQIEKSVLHMTLLL